MGFSTKRVWLGDQRQKGIENQVEDHLSRLKGRDGIDEKEFSTDEYFPNIIGPYNNENPMVWRCG